MRSRLGILAAVVAAFLTGAIVIPAGAAPGDLRRSNNTGGSSVLVPQIPGTPCWRLGSQTFRPEGTPFSACTATPTTTTTVAPTTTSTTTTTVAPTTTAGTTTTVPTTTTTLPPGGSFVEPFNDLSRWVFAHRRYEMPANSDAPSTATIVNGQARIYAADQNYGDATLRSLVPYNLTGGGTVTLDISQNTEGWPLLGSAYVFFSATPYDAAAQMADERDIPYDAAAMPTEGVAVRLNDNCRSAFSPIIVVSYNPSVPGGRTTQRGQCVAPVDGRLRLVYTPGSLSIRNGAGVEIVAYPVTIPPTGFLTLGVHNHASDKYDDGPGPMPAVIGLFDNVTYPVGSGGVPATTLPATTTTTVAPTTTVPAPTTLPTPGFVETFDSAASLERFDWVLRDGRTEQLAGQTWNADHSHACGDTTTHRTLTGPADGQPFQVPLTFDPVATGVAYWCPNAGGHMMTSFNTSGYSHLDFTPNRSFTNVQEICWDVNVTNMGNRKWLQVAVVPEAVFQANGRRLDYTSPDFNPGPGFWGAPVSGGVAMISILQSSLTSFGSLSGDNYAIFGGPNKADRFETCLDRTGNVTQHGPGGVVRVTDLGGSLPSGEVRVIFQDVSYHPDKAAGESPAAAPDPYTWHWDNLVITTG